MRPVLDVAALPAHGLGRRSLTWWGTLGMMCIEGMLLALLLASYFYLKDRQIEWPIHNVPGLFWGTLNTILLLCSAIPNQLTKQAADRHDVSGVRLWIVVTVVIEIIIGLVRILEFRSLNVWWDDNAYGSVLWVILSFHTVHLITDTIDSVVVTLLFFTTPIAGRRFAYASENALYWYFVIGIWIPIYAVVYVVPRLW